MTRDFWTTSLLTAGILCSASVAGAQDYVRQLADPGIRTIALGGLAILATGLALLSFLVVSCREVRH